jgi:hypothetical protein
MKDSYFLVFVIDDIDQLFFSLFAVELVSGCFLAVDVQDCLFVAFVRRVVLRIRDLNMNIERR